MLIIGFVGFKLLITEQRVVLFSCLLNTSLFINKYEFWVKLYFF